MPVVTKLLRNTPGPYLRDYFERQGIAVVRGRVRLVRFLANDNRTYVTLEGKNPNESVYASAERLFKGRNPFRGGYTIAEVVLSVTFERDRVNPRGRTVSVKLRHPNGCSIGETCAKERLIRRKYLSAWGIVATAAAAA